MNFLSASNHCIVQIVASSEILINFQQQVVQEQGKVTKQKPDRKFYPTWSTTILLMQNRLK